MIKKILLTIGVLSFAYAPISSADFLNGLGQNIIPAPASVVDDAVDGGAENTNQEGFLEASDVTLASDLEVDGAADIPAGTVVTSHMIFLNTPDSGVTTDANVVWTFDGPILGVMSDKNGTLEDASNAELGAPGTVYPGGFGARGMEGADNYTINNDYQLRVTMLVAEPGDWIRVITAPRTQQVDFCHVPPGNPENAQEITIGINAVAKHIKKHGSYFLGECPE